MIRSQCQILSLIFCLLFASLLQAQDTPFVHQLFDQLVSELKPQEASQSERDLAITTLEQMRAFTNPELQMGFGRTRFGDFEGNYQEFILSQTIPLNGLRRGTREKMRATEELAIVNQRMTRFEAEQEALLFIFAHQRNQEMAAHIKERVERLSLVEQFLRTRKFASPRDQIDREQLRFRLRILRAEMFGIQSLINRSTQFFQAYGEPSSIAKVQVKWPSTESFKRLGAKIQGEQGLVAQSFKLRAQLLAQDVQVAKTLWRPDLRLYAMQTYEGQPFQAAQINEALGFSLQLPLFDRGQYQIRQAEAQQVQLQIEQIKLERQRSFMTISLQEEIGKLLKILADSGSQNRGSEDKVMELATAQFKKGQIPIHQFLDLDDQIHADIHMRLQARYDLVRSHLELMAQNKIDLNLKEIFL